MWISDDDLGSNTNYYLCNEKRFRVLSPYRIWTDGNANMIYVHFEGFIGGDAIEFVNSGVHILRIML